MPARSIHHRKRRGAAQFGAPWGRQVKLGTAIGGGVMVAVMRRSMSPGTRPASAMAAIPASTARSELPVGGSTKRRSTTPVRVRIHSSVVSTKAAQSALVVIETTVKASGQKLDTSLLNDQNIIAKLNEVLTVVTRHPARPFRVPAAVPISR